jgi:hypothetical protein
LSTSRAAAAWRRRIMHDVGRRPSRSSVVTAGFGRVGG